MVYNPPGLSGHPTPFLLQPYPSIIHNPSSCRWRRAIYLPPTHLRLQCPLKGLTYARIGLKYQCHISGPGSEPCQ